MDYRKKIVLRLKEKVKNSFKKRILFIDGDDPRAISAAKRLVSEELAEVSLLVKEGGNRKDEYDGLSYVDINSDSKLTEELELEYVKLRRGKESLEQAKTLLKQRPYFAAMLLKKGLFDGVVGGLLYTTSDILRAGFKIIGPLEGTKTISSCMLMIRGDEIFVFSDISVNVSPDSKQLAEIALNAARFAKKIGLEPKIAFLSFSTAGSARNNLTEAVSSATEIFRQLSGNIYPTIGEVQFDAAMDSKIRMSKYKDKVFEDSANVLIFPDLDSGNIGYKIAQRLGGFLAVGPIVTGISLPFNDLSRGATVDDVYFTAVLTALDSF